MNIDLIDNAITIAACIFYPTFMPEATTSIGAYKLPVALNASPRNVPTILVVISHGSGGSYFNHILLAHFLAKHGCIVTMFDHPYNNRKNNSQEATLANFINRPKHIHCIIQWCYDSLLFSLLPNSVTIIGHSLGGYAALAVAGGEPKPLPHQVVDVTDITVAHDSRIKSLVLLAPATVWFQHSNALRNVTCPILLYVGNKDDMTGPECTILRNSGHKADFLPYGYHVYIVLNGVPDYNQIQCRLVDNAGHFCFLGPFPEAILLKKPVVAQDHSGFDRAAFHTQFYAEILAFLSLPTQT